MAAAIRSPVPYVGDKLHKLGGVLETDSAKALYLGLARTGRIPQRCWALPSRSFPVGPSSCLPLSR